MKKILILALYCMGLTSCTAAETPENPSFHTSLEIAEPALVTPYKGETRYIALQANTSWTIRTTAPWVSVSPQRGNAGAATVAVTIQPAAAESRSAEIVLASGNTMAQLSVPVFQMEPDELLVSPSTARTIPIEGGELKFSVACQKEVAVASDGDWLTTAGVERITPQVAIYTYAAAANTGRSRSCRLQFKESGSNAVEMVVTQEGSIAIPDKEGATIKGEVTAEGKPLAGVVVSDGYEVTTTDREGFYWLASAKKNGSVFISIPSGYMVDCDGSIPAFWQATTAPAGEVETHSFSLRSEPNTNHILLATTDPHMANRYNYNKTYTDTPQYRNDFRGDIDDFVAKNGSARIYAICLGDLTWDIYWYDKGTNYTLESYRKEIETFPVPYFQVIGNHDYDMHFTDDFEAEGEFRRIIGPTYYSFNLGDVHYVVLDNIVYINANSSRNHATYVDDRQLEWLKKDLATVDKSKPVFVCMHCSAWRLSPAGGKIVGIGTFDNDGSARLSDCFKGFASVHFLTGDTHINCPVANEDMPAAYANIFEHNMGAVCASWWWTGYLSQNSICRDGSEGGYMVFTNSGSDVKWRWKGMKVAAERQFRTYDMNVVKKHFATDASTRKYLEKYPGNTNYSGCKANTIYINVWNYDSGWRIVVRENGRELPVTRVLDYDPLHTLSYDIPRTAANGSMTSTFASLTSPHLFSATAAAADSSLEIEVTDRFGTVYRETMTRPKAYSIRME